MRVKKALPVIPVPTRCKGCYSPSVTRVRNRIGNGSYQVWDRCKNCGGNAWGKVYYVPHQQAGLTFEEIPLYEDYAARAEPCYVCHQSSGTELHHFAPVHIFGREEAEHWPKEYLCPACHAAWHIALATHAQEDCKYCKGLITRGKTNGKR